MITINKYACINVSEYELIYLSFKLLINNYMLINKKLLITYPNIPNTVQYFPVSNLETFIMLDKQNAETILQYILFCSMFSLF